MIQPTRRTMLRVGLVSAAALAMPSFLAGCSTGGSASAGTAIWIWPGGLSDTVTASAVTKFPDAGIDVSVIGGDFKQKLVTTFTGRSGLPAVTGVKGEDMPYFLQQADLFTDLKPLVSADLLAQFPDWKLAEATTPDGKLLGLPIDIGPTAMYYRSDVLAAAGLPSEPADVAAATATWDDYFAFGEKLKAANGAFIEVSLGDVFSKSMFQSPTKFVDEDGAFLGESEPVKQAWARAVDAHQRGLSAGLQDGSPDWAAAITEGSLPTLLGAAWYQADIKGAAAGTSGSWRVAPMPGGPANIGGSFLTIPAGTEDSAGALEVIEFLLEPENQAISYTETGAFPSSTAAFDQPALTSGDAFFGGQTTVDVFAQATDSMPTTYTGPFDNQVSAPYYTELTNIESQDKDPEAAWNDAVAAAKSALESAA
ncbi:carbohydrate ABC transporter substrate-binding protein (CUT1 family) [Rathayibacter sp. PhB152]|uniref:ABC transporter substrate-binding protein n=1 Tax=unclassified Rathayibacter TaxID=2609250 RepID=UPI000F4C74B8|nr:MULTISPECIES: extracellular solute-binding protein [unclassified Rathayibacter]ROQ60457.1 carbohydrate ABC transporter substrate-binding protein (CUT1 family) [Rathayibacter sp. PhB152]ROS21628.1 carbohydrate ABC transporter substrate-binding protein (CUT1 family) [Rathayibacter sp. PhB127]